MSINRLIGLVIFVILLAAIGPLALDTLLTWDTTGYPAILVTLIENFPIFVGIVFLVAIVGFLGIRAGIGGRS